MPRESKADKIVRARLVEERMLQHYGEGESSLDYHGDPFKLVCAVVLSAQCTDAAVNKVTPLLFKKYPTCFELAAAQIPDVEEIIHSLGFFRAKAVNLVKLSRMLVEDFNGEVPNDLNLLQKLPGVGRKTANVVLLEAFGIAEGIAVDTHAKRISNLIGLSKESDPLKIEQDLLKIINNEYIKDVNHLLVWHGRNTCIARKPKCDICPIKKYCNFARFSLTN